MKRQLLALGLSLLLVHAAKAETPVYFEDQELKALVEQTLWISDPTPSDMLALTRLESHHGEITSLIGLEYATNLETLSITWSPLRDLSPLSDLTGLRTLRLHGNQISDISALSKLTDLRELDLRMNFITDISVLSRFTSLHTLGLHRNRIINISPLAVLTSLQWLDLRLNPLSQDALDVYADQIKANNPGIEMYIAADPTFSPRLLITSSAGGAVAGRGEGDFVYEYDDTVVLEATPDPGFVFVKWTGTFNTSRNPVRLTLQQDHEIRAVFQSVQDVIHVDCRASGNLEEDGTLEHPLASIQDAIEVAPDGATIFVAGGIYHESIDFQGKSIQVKGFDWERSEAGAWPVIDSGGRGIVACFTHGEDSNSVLSGFVLTGGKAASGAAILCSASSPTITNCLIVGSRVTNWTGGVIHCADSSATFVNCTVADNYGGQYGAALYLVNSPVVVVNSIFWRDTPTEIITDGVESPSIRYSTIAGGWPGPGNLATDPLFAGAAHWVRRIEPGVMVGLGNPGAVLVIGDYHLQSEAGRWDAGTGTWVKDKVSSPCIDKGDPAIPVGQEPLPNGGIIDMGAYGGTAEASQSSSHCP